MWLLAFTGASSSRDDNKLIIMYILMWLYIYLQGNSALEMAILMKQVEAITLLLQHGADVNMKNNKVRKI